MMVRLFKWFVVVMSGLLVVWWLNIPFLDSQKNTDPTIVTSTPILEDLITRIVGPDINIVSLVERTTDPITQSIPVEKLMVLETADVVVLNGGGLEANYGDLSKYIRKGTTVINIHDLMSKYEKKWPTYYWMSPVSWNKLVHYLQIKLKNKFPKRRSEINYRKMAYTNDIYSLYQSIKSSLDRIPKNKKIILSNHVSFAPFAKAFGFKFMAFNLMDPLDETALNNMVDTLKKKNIRVLHPNDAVSKEGIDALVKAALAQGWQLSVGKPIFSLNIDVKGSGVDSYIKMMEFNSRSLGDG